MSEFSRWEFFRIGFLPAGTVIKVGCSLPAAPYNQIKTPSTAAYSNTLTVYPTPGSSPSASTGVRRGHPLAAHSCSSKAADVLHQVWKRGTTGWKCSFVYNSKLWSIDLLGVRNDIDVLIHSRMRNRLSLVDPDKDNHEAFSLIARLRFSITCRAIPPLERSSWALTRP